MGALVSFAVNLLDRLPVHHRVHAERPQLTKRLINCLKKVLSQQLKKVLSSLYGWALSCTKRIPGLPAPTVGSDSWSKDFILIYYGRKGAVPQPEELNANWTPQYLAVSSGTSKGHHLMLSAITAPPPPKKKHLEKKKSKKMMRDKCFYRPPPVKTIPVLGVVSLLSLLCTWC